MATHCAPDPDPRSETQIAICGVKFSTSQLDCSNPTCIWCRRKVADERATCSRCGCVKRDGICQNYGCERAETCPVHVGVVEPCGTCQSKIAAGL